jgi:hypothetical protein
VHVKSDRNHVGLLSAMWDTEFTLG